MARETRLEDEYDAIESPVDRARFKLERDKLRWEQSTRKAWLTWGPTAALSVVGLAFSAVQWWTSEAHKDTEAAIAAQKAQVECFSFYEQNVRQKIDKETNASILSMLGMVKSFCPRPADVLLANARTYIGESGAMEPERKNYLLSEIGLLIADSRAVAAAGPRASEPAPSTAPPPTLPAPSTDPASPPAATGPAPVASACAADPRGPGAFKVFIQYAGPGQNDRPVVDEVADALRTAGFRVPQGKEPVARPTSAVEIRYYREDQASIACRLAEEVGRALEAAGHPLKPTYLPISGKYPNLPDGVLELWLPRLSAS